MDTLSNVSTIENSRPLQKALLNNAGQAFQAELDQFIEQNDRNIGLEISNPHADEMTVVLRDTAKWLREKYSERSVFQTTKPHGEDPETFPRQADLLRRFTQMWSILQLAWRQSQETTSQTSRAIAAGNKVARGLYEIGQAADLNLILPDQYLVVVSAGTEGYSIGFDLPTPYIISPYWGVSQVWTWLGYVHEIGHHIYRNIDGLKDELKVNVTLELWRMNGVKRKHQLIWFNWIEEIFADLFGLLRIGPAFAHTQQLMLPYLPQPQAWPEIGNRLLVADDIYHPMPYLRIFLSICALEKLGIYAEEVKLLRTNLEKLGGSPTPERLYALIHGGSQELSLFEMQAMADAVLDVILNTKLISLAKKAELNDKTKQAEARSIKDVFFNTSQKTYELLLKSVYDNLNELLKKSPTSTAIDIDKLNDRVIARILSGNQAVQI